MAQLGLYSDRCVHEWLAGQSLPWYVRICSKIRILANRSHNNQKLESDWLKFIVNCLSRTVMYIINLLPRGKNGTKDSPLNNHSWYER